ncbi:MAG: hypothetical protein H0T53_09125 [Herpetosiphonaceae bacterium]|nr:hypothetical protein [Herpetosiphonaceae bacterium]
MSDQNYADIESGPGVVPVDPQADSGAVQPSAVPPANPHADRAQQLADGILDRDVGEDYNPNTSQTVEENRARFEAVNAEIAATHQHLVDEIVPVIDRVVAEANAAASDPNHQAMLADQQAHASSDPLATHAGAEYGSRVPPHLYDASSAPQPVDKRREIGDPNGPAVPVKNNSLRKDS